MPIPGLNADRCRTRNTVAARHGLNAASIVFLRGPEPPAPENLVLARVGELPADDADALARINARRTGGPELAADDVYVHYCEAGSDVLVPDRWMFLGLSTLRNCAADAMRGFSLMNSHATGGLSGPAELPFGQAFAGRFEQVTDGEGTRRRCVLGVFMPRRNAAGEPYRPNGANGPSSADLHTGIITGAIQDVSLGLYGGEPICDLCGEDLRDTTGSDPWEDDYLCPHAPGTFAAMTPDQVRAQLGRGVPEGRATWTLENARPGEVSPVYDGAVPGAGFRKALSLARRGRLDEQALQFCKTSYAPLARERDFAPRTGAEATNERHAQRRAELESLLTNPEGGLPDGLTLDDHTALALAAVAGLTTRLETLSELRGSEGRRLSAPRLAARDELVARLQALGRQQADPERVRQLRRLILEDESKRREPQAVAGA